jgi:hypothetical protein
LIGGASEVVACEVRGEVEGGAGAEEGEETMVVWPTQRAHQLEEQRENHADMLPCRCLRCREVCSKGN